MRIQKNLWILILVVAMLAVGPLESGAAPRFDAGIGIGYNVPRDGDLSDLYGNQFSYQISVAGSIPKPDLSIALDIGYASAKATLSRPFFVEAARSELVQVPFDLIARVRFSGGRMLRPYLGGGLELLWSQEEFHYRFDETDRRQDPDSRLDTGIVIVAGVDRVHSPRLRLEGFVSIVESEHTIHTGGVQYGGEGRYDFDAGSMGLRISWRLP